MAKRPRLSTHLKLADPSLGPDEPLARSSEKSVSPGPDHSAQSDQILTILDDAAGEAIRLHWLAWSNLWQTHMRLALYWLRQGGNL